MTEERATIETYRTLMVDPPWRYDGPNGASKRPVPGSA
jgi:hypothetical protein